MIKVVVNKENSKINKIIITGHAKYDEYGKDIVCSAVSSIIITTVNGISKLNDNYLEVQEEKDKMILLVKKEDEVCLKLLENMLELLEELSINYPKNIIIK